MACTLAACAGPFADWANRPPSDAEIRARISEQVMVLAAQDGRADIVAFALARGADPDAREPELERTALMLAAQSGQLETMAVLLAAGADPDARTEDGWTALIHAAAEDRPEAVRLLLETGADPGLRDRVYGYDALMIASLLGHVDSVAALIDGGAEVDAVDPREGATPLILAAGSRARTAAETVAELLVRGAEADRPRDDGTTPLMAASDAGNLAAAGLLLSEGVRPDRRAEDGSTALGLAAAAGRAPMVDLLLRYGAGPDTPSTAGQTPLMLASGHGAIDAARRLIRAGADVNAASQRSGATPLILAAARGDAPMVRLLLAAGADRRLTDRDGLTALGAARRRAHADVVQELTSGL